MALKICTNCKTAKHKISFGKHSISNDGLQYVCKSCKKIQDKEYSMTKEGLVTKIYSHQKSSSKQRGHKSPAYSKQELSEWLQAQPLFHHLFHLWKVSNYDAMLVPSIDRIDNNIPYSFSNIQIMTWGENKAKGHLDMRSGKLIHGHKPQKPVFQFTKKGEFVSEFVSLNEASRQAGVHHGHISKVCKGERKSAGGFVWRYKNA